MTDGQYDSRDTDLISDERADDLDRRLALVFQWPYADAWEEMRADIERTLGPLVSTETIPGVTPSPRLSPYQVGPAAAGLFQTVVYSFYQNVMPVLQDGATLIAIGAFTREAVRALRQRFANVWHEPQAAEYAHHFGPDHFHPVLTKVMIQALCYEHFASTYNTSKRLRLSASVRSAYPEYSSAGHPGGMETYTVQIRVGKSSYFYVIDSKGKSVEHFELRKGQMTPLPLPNWFDEYEGYMYRPEARTTIRVEPPSQ